MPGICAVLLMALLLPTGSFRLMAPGSPAAGAGAGRLGRSPRMTAAAAQRVDVLVAGGGPAGLAAATSLAAGGLSVVVVERRPSASTFEAQRAYLYLLDKRGQRWTDAFNLTAPVRERGVSNDGYTITRAYPDRRGVMTMKPILAAEATRTAIWVPRATLLDVLATAASAAGAELRYGATLQALERSPDSGDGGICAVLGDGTRLMPRLVLGCDGLDSRVRAALRAWTAEAGGDASVYDPVSLPSPSSGLQYKMLLVPPSFPILNLSSSSSQPAAPPPPPVQTQPQSAYVLPSSLTRANDRIRLGLLPSRDASVPRTANVIKPSTHRVWQMATGEELLAFLAKSFPQIEDIQTLVTRQEASGRGIAYMGARARGGAMCRLHYPVSVEPQIDLFVPVWGDLPLLPPPPPLQANSFVSSPPGRFPAPQFIRGLSCVVGGTGFALLGDAAHAFPPDLGQGVNSALEDVSALLGAMREQGIASRNTAPQRGVEQPGGGGAPDTVLAGAGLDGAALARALEAYQRERAPAAEALARIMQVGFPYQYDQSVLASRQFLAGFALRLLLSRTLGRLPLAGRLFAPPVAIGVLDAEPYIDVWRRATRTTRVVQTAAAMLVIVVARRLARLVM